MKAELCVMWEPGFLTEALGSGEREVAGKLLGEEEPAPGSGSAPGCEAPSKLLIWMFKTLGAGSESPPVPVLIAVINGLLG